jgi:hypothetical protein
MVRIVQKIDRARMWDEAETISPAEPSLQAAIKQQEREEVCDDNVDGATILRQSSMLIMAQMVGDV